MCTLEPSLKVKNYETNLCQKCKRNFYLLNNDQLENQLIEFGIFIPITTKDKKIISCNGFIDIDDKSKHEGENNDC